MNRTEWKAFSHSLRKDAHDFKKQHGGYPSMLRSFQHNDQEWVMKRSLDNNRDGWQTNIRKSRIGERAWQGRAADCLNECRDYHEDLKTTFKGKHLSKRAIRAAVNEARAIREAEGWQLTRITIDRSIRYHAA